ncbi:hypothetical protein XENOCAPTIV_010158 [Xenoophorus captivus]|uniref:Uncharacterized protein n=1 Tax=Xenoophorus captivus TaxID=1517983 RepID=A0ABV0R7W9_9TELE
MFPSCCSRFTRWSSDLHEQTRFLVNLFCAAAERDQQTGEKMLEMLASVCRYEAFPLKEQDVDDKDQSDFLLDLYSQMKDCETKTGLSLFPSLQSVFQSAPPVWIINLSERKTSILLEVLKLQSEKKPVELMVCSHEESEVRSFLQCLPYISQLRFYPQRSDLHEETRFIVNLFCAAAERDQQTGEKMLEMLASVCRYKTFPLKEQYIIMRDNDGFKYQSDFLLDLYSQMKDCETKTGLSLLPSLQSVFQLAPAVWTIKLSERKTSILLEVLKLQSEKKPVKLMVCSLEESEVRSFLQYLPYISELRYIINLCHVFLDVFIIRISLCKKNNVKKKCHTLMLVITIFAVFCLLSDNSEQIILVNLLSAAAERDQQTGEKMLEMLASVCRYKTLPLD